jgi:clathrin heavy chain
VERVCRDSVVYNADEVKQYLKEAKLPDPRPLIHVCDRYGPVTGVTSVACFAALCGVGGRVRLTARVLCACSHDMVDELTQYLVQNNLLKFVEVYVQKVSPQKAPIVVGKLLDLDQDEEFIKRLIDSVRHQCPVQPLVEEVEMRNRLRMLQPWLEQRITEGNVEPATHNAIGKIYITINKEPQTFLRCVATSCRRRAVRRVAVV